MLLSDRRIRQAMDAGDIVIEPFEPGNLGTNSYDVRLGEFYFEPNRNMQTVSFLSEEQTKRFWGEPIRAHDVIAVRPGDTILAHTREIVGGRNGYTTSMRARSSIGRSCMSVCKCAGVGDVGYIARWTMEITNHSHATIALPVGLRVAQILFFEVGETDKHYEGKYGQSSEWSPYDMLPRLYNDPDMRSEQ
ncbi:MAG: dCTP deaminase [Chloroflexota bacterium]|nr:dCTP deaminase [Chloroflexota bacterium]